MMQDFKTRRWALCGAMAQLRLSDEGVSALKYSTERNIVANIEAIAKGYDRDTIQTAVLSKFAIEHLKAQVKELGAMGAAYRAQSDAEMRRDVRDRTLPESPIAPGAGGARTIREGQTTPVEPAPHQGDRNREALDDAFERLGSGAVGGICPRTGDDLTDHSPGFERRAAEAIAGGMSTFSKKCSACGHEWEHPVTFAQDGECHKCGGAVLLPMPPKGSTIKPYPQTQCYPSRLRDLVAKLSEAGLDSDSLLEIAGAASDDVVDILCRREFGSAQVAVNRFVFTQCIDPHTCEECGAIWILSHCCSPASLTQGDTVRLKSGGALMTVRSVGPGGHCQCQWFVDGDVIDGSFHASMLVEGKLRHDDPAQGARGGQLLEAVAGGGTHVHIHTSDPMTAAYAVTAASGESTWPGSDNDTGEPINPDAPEDLAGSIIAAEKGEAVAEALSELRKAAVCAFDSFDATGKAVTIHIGDPKCGVALIAKERERQKAKWSAEHDGGHKWGTLAVNAARLLVYPTDATVADPGQEYRPNWGLAEKHAGDQMRQLVIAGALIAAEIDRLQAVRDANNAGCEACGDVMLTNVGEACPECQSDGDAMPVGIVTVAALQSIIETCADALEALCAHPSLVIDLWANSVDADGIRGLIDHATQPPAVSEALAVAARDVDRLQVTAA